MAPLGRFPFPGCFNHGCLVHIEYAPLDILAVYLLGPHRFVLLCVKPSSQYDANRRRRVDALDVYVSTHVNVVHKFKFTHVWSMA